MENGFKITPRMAIMSHLSDAQDAIRVYNENSVAANHIRWAKVILMHYDDLDATVTSETINNLSTEVYEKK